jgi:hypothetical protein
MAGGYPVFGGKIKQQGNVFHPLSQRWHRNSATGKIIKNG